MRPAIKHYGNYGQYVLCFGLKKKKKKTLNIHNMDIDLHVFRIFKFPYFVSFFFSLQNLVNMVSI